MFNDKHPEVLIAGAGPVGLFAALALAKRGIPVQIVDTGVWPCQHSYALALHPQAVELIDELGLKDAVLDSAYVVKRIGLCDTGGCKRTIELAAGAGEGSCVAVLRQDVLEELLEKALAELGVKVSWRHEVARLTPGENSVEARINKFEKESRGYIVAHTEWVVSRSTDAEFAYVVGADGHNSLVRRTLGIDFAEVGDAAYYAVFEFASDADCRNEMRLVLGDATTDVLWPLPEGNCRWSFQLPGYVEPVAEQVERLRKSGYGATPMERTKDRVLLSEGGHEPVLTDESLRSLIAERAPWFTSSIDRIDWRIVVRFERRLAASFGRGRLWLAGDSAHMTGPAGIQSMNLGLAEAHDLANALHGILRRGASESLLDAYNRKWNANWKQLHGLDGSLHAGPDADPWITGHGASLLSCLPAHGDRLAGLLAQVGLSF